MVVKVGLGVNVIRRFRLDGEGSVVVECDSISKRHVPGFVGKDVAMRIWHQTDSESTQPAFIVYVAATLSLVLALVVHFEPRYGLTNIPVYLGICSLMGSITVVSIKAIEIAIKLTLDS